VVNYDALPQDVRTVVETFLQAMRQAQPFRLPPGSESSFARSLPLAFKLGDL
jgi:hypothetical protein